jgi:signal transduction histidine kinase
MWVAMGGGGQFQWKDGVWKFTTVLKDHPDWSANAAFTDGADRIWLAWGDRVAVWDHGNVRTFSAANGLSIGPFNIIAGRNDQIWIGGESGLAFLQGSRFQVLKSADGGTFGSVTGIVLPDNDGLWLSAGSGIVHIPEHEVRHALHDLSYRVNYEVFDVTSDLPEQLQREATYSSGAIEGTDGLLWFAGQTGIAQIDRVHIFRNPLPPPVAIRSVRADGKQYPSKANLTLPALTRNLRIDYTALSLSLPERVHFRYKLEGADKDWQDAGTRREAFYTTLPPGSYRFHVVACNNDRIWNEQGAVLGFIIAPAWYQTTWFLALCGAGGALVVLALYRLRMRQVARSLRARFDERLAERTRVAREIHDTLLQTVQGSKMVADDALDKSSDPARMRRALEQLSLWLGQANQEGRAALNSLRTSTTATNDLAEALRRAIEDCRRQGPMETSFSVIGVAKEMHPVVRDEVYRIGYEAIRNACMHSHGSRLDVRLSYTQDLTLRVVDNGVGIDPAIANDGKEGHFGFQGMRERAARIDAKLSVVSSAGSGTEILVIVPARTIFHKPTPTLFNRIKTAFYPPDRTQR